jgi:4-amino-4-deoxy-L-arabinose transferase-like glycosyltransferase
MSPSDSEILLPTNILGRRSTRVLCIGYLAATTLYVAMVLMAGSGVRGSDQLWYIQEAQTVLDGKLKVSNEVYPHPFLQNHRVDNPFMHHTLGLYCVAAAGKLLGVVRGWQFTLVLATIIAGACVAWLVHHFTRQVFAACVAYAFYLLNPLTAWQSVNILMEPLYGMFMALAALQYVTAEKDKVRWLLLLATLALAIQCRPIFLPLLLGLPLAFLFHAGRPIQPKNVLISAGFLGLGCLAILINKLLFDNALPPTLADGIRCSGPGKGLMEYYFVLSPPPVKVGMLWEKFIWAMKTQFFNADIRTAPLFWFYNLNIVGSAIFLFRSLRNPQVKIERRLAFFACFAFVIHLAFISLHHSQARVCMAFLAPQMACAAVVAAQCWRSVKFTGVLATSAIMIVFLGVDSMASHKVRNDAAAFRSEQDALAENLAIIPSHDRIMYESLADTGHMPVTYATHPRLTLILASSHRYSADVYRKLQNEFHARWLICPENSPLPEMLLAEKVSLKIDLRGKMSKLSFYRLPIGKNAATKGSIEQ